MPGAIVERPRQKRNAICGQDAAGKAPGFRHETGMPLQAPKSLSKILRIVRRSLHFALANLDAI